MWRGISLANKCLLLFGAAVVLTIVAALTIPWLRMGDVVDEAQHETSRQVIATWQSTRTDGGVEAGVEDGVGESRIRVVDLAAAEVAAEQDAFVRAALARFGRDATVNERTRADWQGTARRYRIVRAVRDEEGTLTGIILLDRLSTGAAMQSVLNTAYLLSAGLIAGGVAVLVFYLITTRLILSPVRSLRETAESVRQGDLRIRSDIHTGDEFEELAQTFNQMVEELATSQDQLRAINTSLDLKLNELAERNMTLFESNKLKGEFLASVSHELRTPLHSIIGFAELLDEIAQREEHAGDDSTRLAKRRRYLGNILASGRNLLEMINDLLEMARVEAGKVELSVETVSVADLCEALMALMRPVADKARVELRLELSPDLPTIETDAQKLRQVVFNLLSNAVKFTGDSISDAGGGTGAAAAPHAGTVTLRAERLSPRAVEGAGSEERIRISVLDTGPGIAMEDQKLIFEKFKQLDSGHTRRHAGTGLGLAICKELTGILQGEISVESEVGRGAMFSVILPLRLAPDRAAEMRLEMAFRGTLAGQRGA